MTNNSASKKRCPYCVPRVADGGTPWRHRRFDPWTTPEPREPAPHCPWRCPAPPAPKTPATFPNYLLVRDGHLVVGSPLSGTHGAAVCRASKNVVMILRREARLGLLHAWDDLRGVTCLLCLASKVAP